VAAARREEHVPGEPMGERAARRRAAPPPVDHLDDAARDVHERGDGDQRELDREGRPIDLPDERQAVVSARPRRPSSRDATRGSANADRERLHPRDTRLRSPRSRRYRSDGEAVGRNSPLPLDDRVERTNSPRDLLGLEPERAVVRRR
jgi:hypothetical protein